MKHIKHFFTGIFLLSLFLLGAGLALLPIWLADMFSPKYLLLYLVVLVPSIYRLGKEHHEDLVRVKIK